jgi:hypothetical protein
VTRLLSGEKKMRILITGSRTWTDKVTIANAIREAWLVAGRPYGVVVVHGGARGADYIAGVYAKRLGFSVEVHPVTDEEWTIKGKSAGHQRNAHMVSLGADVCLAFIKNESRGATGCAALAEKAGIPTHIWRE